ncbi:hypothetical protein BB347_16330 [Natronorubrum daqingense]|uniref:Uncharacterized protein n=1 Tax=Natronorubrum daqingense TaxID=588898 RepID=A0A1P8RHA8_9EURY|nr:hypothetical protein BB347_16330 [Natronorubrum daqingense]
MSNRPVTAPDRGGYERGGFSNPFSMVVENGTVGDTKNFRSVLWKCFRPLLEELRMDKSIGS